MMFSNLNIEKDNKSLFFFVAPAKTVYMGSPGCGWLPAGSGWQVGPQWCPWCPCTGCYCAPRSEPGHWGQSQPTQRCTGLPPEWSRWCHSVPPDHCYLNKKGGLIVKQTAENGGLSQNLKGHRLTWNPVIHRGAVIGRVNGL